MTTAARNQTCQEVGETMHGVQRHTTQAIKHCGHTQQANSSMAEVGSQHGLPTSTMPLPQPTAAAETGDAQLLHTCY